MTFPIPEAALANHLAILGKTGSGKSNAAKTIVEAALDRDERVCVLDPTGAWYGLRLDAKGRASTYEIAIFGGQHADLPLNASHGGAIAEAIGTTSGSAIIDTRLLTVGARTQLFTDFAETLLRANRGPLTLVIDEAHLFAPQGRVADPQSGKMLHAANNLVSLGRSIGLRVIMLSQRPAKLHKDSLTQVETLIAMRLIAPQDRAAIEAWIGEWAEPAQGKEIIASLPSLPTGDAWLWSPEIGVLERVHFPLASTFDSGRAPTHGGEEIALKPLNLDQLKGRLALVEQEAKASDPRLLKAEVARLTRELAAAKKGGAPEWPDQREDVDHLDADNRRLRQQMRQVIAEREHARGLLSEIFTLARRVTEIPAPAEVQPMATPARPRRQPAPPRERPESDGSVPQGCTKPLAALAAVYPSGLTEAQWATSAGYKRSGGTWGTYKSRLRGAGLIEGRDGRWFATEAGAAAAGDIESPPEPGPDLVRWWAAKLPGTTRMAEALIEAWPQWLTREQLAEAIEMSASGGSFGTYVSRLAGPGLIDRGADGIRLSQEAMGQ